jgi:formyl-CoA transferase
VLDETLGPVTMQAPVPRMSRTPGRINRPGPHLGHDTAEVLKELGFSDAEIERGARDGSWGGIP